MTLTKKAVTCDLKSEMLSMSCKGHLCLGTRYTLLLAWSNIPKAHLKSEKPSRQLYMFILVTLCKGHALIPHVSSLGQSCANGIKKAGFEIERCTSFIVFCEG